MPRREEWHPVPAIVEWAGDALLILIETRAIGTQGHLREGFVTLSGSRNESETFVIFGALERSLSLKAARRSLDPQEPMNKESEREEVVYRLFCSTPLALCVHICEGGGDKAKGVEAGSQDAQT